MNTTTMENLSLEDNKSSEVRQEEHFYQVSDFTGQVERWQGPVSKKLGEFIREHKYMCKERLRHMRFSMAMIRLLFPHSNVPRLDTLNPERVVQDMLTHDPAYIALRHQSYIKALDAIVPRHPSNILEQLNDAENAYATEVAIVNDPPDLSWVSSFLDDFKAGVMPRYVLSRAFAHLIHGLICNSPVSTLTSPDFIWHRLPDDIQACMTVDSVGFFLTEWHKERAAGPTEFPTEMFRGSDHRIPFFLPHLNPYNLEGYATHYVWKSDCDRVSGLVGRRVYVYLPKPIYSCCPPCRYAPGVSEPTQDICQSHTKVAIMTLPDGFPYSYADDPSAQFVDDHCASNDSRGNCTHGPPNTLVFVVHGLSPSIPQSSAHKGASNEPRSFFRINHYVPGHEASITTARGVGRPRMRCVARGTGSRGVKRQLATMVCPRRIRYASLASVQGASNSQGLSGANSSGRAAQPVVSHEAETCQAILDHSPKEFVPALTRGIVFCKSKRLARVVRYEQLLLCRFYEAIDQVGQTSQDSKALHQRIIEQEVAEAGGPIYCGGDGAFSTLEMVELLLRSRLSSVSSGWSYHQWTHLVEAIEKLGGDPSDGERVTPESVLELVKDVDDGFGNITIDTVVLHLALLKLVWKELPVDEPIHTKKFRPMQPLFWEG